jgi:hypothetical protein
MSGRDLTIGIGRREPIRTVEYRGESPAENGYVTVRLAADEAVDVIRQPTAATDSRPCFAFVIHRPAANYTTPLAGSGRCLPHGRARGYHRIATSPPAVRVQSLQWGEWTTTSSSI